MIDLLTVGPPDEYTEAQLARAARIAWLLGAETFVLAEEPAGNYPNGDDS